MLWSGTSSKRISSGNEREREKKTNLCRVSNINIIFFCLSFVWLSKNQKTHRELKNLLLNMNMMGLNVLCGYFCGVFTSLSSFYFVVVSFEFEYHILDEALGCLWLSERVWNLYTLCQCIRHLTKRWIEIDSMATMTKIRLPNNSELEERNRFDFRGRIQFGSRCYYYQMMLMMSSASWSREEAKKRRKENQFTDSYTWCLVFISFCVALFHSRFSSISMDLFRLYLGPSIFMICLIGLAKLVLAVSPI